MRYRLLITTLVTPQLPRSGAPISTTATVVEFSSYDEAEEVLKQLNEESDDLEYGDVEIVAIRLYKKYATVKQPTPTEEKPLAPPGRIVGGYFIPR